MFQKSLKIKLFATFSLQLNPLILYMATVDKKHETPLKIKTLISATGNFANGPWTRKLSDFAITSDYSKIPLFGQTLGAKRVVSDGGNGDEPRKRHRASDPVGHIDITTAAVENSLATSSINSEQPTADGKADLGLTQQIVRQDLEYWSLCASLRTDGNPRMVSYPYYTKHAIMGDSTEFCHIDLNVPRFLANGDGANAIQGSMSLDDETPNSCTEVLLGFHHHLDSWWAKVEARGQATNGEVHDLSAIWTKDDDEEYGPFSAVPCQRGGVRVTRPDIPHGSTATILPEGACRRTILPWFVDVQADNLTLDNPAGGTWRDLLHAHVEQTQPQQTPSGFTTQHFPVPECFPASVQLCPLSPVGRALICQAAWNDPRVEEEANAVLGDDRLLAQNIICQRRLEALQDFKVSFAIMKKREQAAFLEDSYF